VTWVNVGHNPHTVTADDGSVDSGNLDPGETFTVTLDGTGSFAYHCRYHGAPAGLGMAGVVVAGAGTGATAERPQPPPPAKGRTLGVPSDHPTIQEAVDSARPGDLVLVSPGTYREAVVVDTPS
jgi:hypothetical protein